MKPMASEQQSLTELETFSETASAESQIAKDLTANRPKLAVFFSHPTQHHSAMFQYLARNKDIDVHIYYYDPGSFGGMFDPGYATSVAWDVDLTSGTRQRVLRNLLRGSEVHQSRQLNPGVIWEVLKGGFDAILISGYASPSNWLVLAAARLRNSAVWYQSDTSILDMQRKKASRIKDLLRKVFFSNVSKFLVAGDNNKASYQHFHIGEERMVWCPIPVDMARYEDARQDPMLADKLQSLRQRYGIPKEARVVAFCGKLIGIKRPQDLIAALRVLARNDVYGLLIGSGELQDSLQKELEPEDRIVITGFINQSEIPYHMLLADFGVITSEWDAHPLVTTEFAMSGRPIIVSDHCGVWGSHDILRSGENGLLFRCGDVSELAAKLALLLNDDELKTRMGQRSLILAQEQSAEHAAKVVGDLLQNRER